MGNMKRRIWRILLVISKNLVCMRHKDIAYSWKIPISYIEFTVINTIKTTSKLM